MKIHWNTDSRTTCIDRKLNAGEIVELSWEGFHVYARVRVANRPATCSKCLFSGGNYTCTRNIKIYGDDFMRNPCNSDLLYDRSGAKYKYCLVYEDLTEGLEDL